MSKRIKKLFEEAIESKVPAYLFSKIIEEISLEELRAAKRALITNIGFLALSIGGLVFSIKYLVAEITSSGFYQYLTLVFSEGGSIFSYWKELAYALIESLPITASATTLGLIFAFVIFLKRTTGKAKIILPLTA